MQEEGLGDHKRNERLPDTDRTAHHEPVSEMLVVAGTVRRQDHGKQEDGVGEKVDGASTDGEGERDQNQVRETLGEGGHDREVE